MPKFSIVIPLFNKENYIEETLQSVVQQTFKDFEVLLVNDCSTDSSLQKVKRYYLKCIWCDFQGNRSAMVLVPLHFVLGQLFLEVGPSYCDQGNATQASTPISGWFSCGRTTD